MTETPPRLRTRSLRRSAVTIVVAWLLAMVVLAWWVAGRTDRALLRLEQQRFQASTEQLAEIITYGVLARSAALLEEPLGAFARAPDMVRVSVFDDSGALLLSRDGAAAREALVSATATVRTRAAPPGAGSDGNDPFEQVLTATPREVGRVFAEFSSQATRSIQNETRLAIVTAVLGVGAAGVLAVALWMSRLLRRLRALQHATGRVRRGELDVHLVDDRLDEVSNLVHDFNAMSASLKAQQQSLSERETLAALGRATAVIAHELKNPLGIVMGAAQIVNNRERPEAARTEAAGIIIDETRRLAGTLDELLREAKPRAASVGEVDVSALCQHVIDRVGLDGGPAANTRVTLSGPPCRARTDGTHLERALWNLVQNSAQAGAGTVQLTVALDAPHVTVTVSDDGEGLDAAMQAQLFVPFTTTKQRGTGLGLAGARRGLRDAGGDLRYAGAGLAGRGATFVIELQAHASTQGAQP